MFIRTTLIAALFFLEGAVPLHHVVFQKNSGEAPADIHYVFTAPAYQIDFKRSAVVLHSNSKSLAVRFTGPVDNRVPEGYARLDNLIHYVDADEPHEKHAHPTFASLRYNSLYAGIDLVFYARRSQLESDFIVSPDADPGRIRLVVEEVDKVELEDSGELTIAISGNRVRIPPAAAYQMDRANRRRIDVRYELKNSNEISLAVSDYNHQLPLIITGPYSPGF